MRQTLTLFITLLLCISAAPAQTGAVTGVVMDSQSKEPLAGANIIVNGSQAGAFSDDDGTFSIKNLAPGQYMLKVSYVGYLSAEIDVTVEAATISKAVIQLKPTAIIGKEITVVGPRAVAGETPAAFSTLDRGEIEARYHAQDIPVLLSEMPSTTFYSENGNGIGYNYITLRGFDQRRISIMINGVPQNDPEDHNVYWIDFPDLPESTEDIQVQRGAGSAFYGPPAIGGSVNIITSHFSPQRKIGAYAGFGSYDTEKYSASVNSGLIKDKFVLSARVSQIKSSGYRERSGVDLKNYFIGGAYFSNRSSLKLHFYGGPIEDQLAFFGIPKKQTKDRATRRNNPLVGDRNMENFNQPHLELIHEYQLGEHLTMTNTLFGIRGYGFFDFDGSWAPMSYFRLTPEYGFAIDTDPDETFANEVLIRADVDNKQVGWLPNFTWRKQRYDLVIGGEFRFHRSEHYGRVQDGSEDLPLAVAGEWNGRDYIGERRYYEYRGGKDIISPYASINYRFSQKLNGMFSLQFVNQRYLLFDEAFIGSDFKVDYQFVNPRAGLNYLLSRNASLFFSYSRTSREPRLSNLYDAAEASTPAIWGAVVPQFQLNADGTFNYDNPLVKPEQLDDFELGFSYKTPRVFAGINLFYMNFRDEIVKSGQVDRFGQPITGNADRTLHAGLELTAGFNMLSNFSFSGNLTVSGNKLKKYSVFEYNDSGEVEEIKLDGNPIAGFPDFMANARLNYQLKPFLASIALQHVGKQYTDNFKNEANTVDAYTAFHGSIGYDLGGIMSLSKLLLQLHVQNIFDTLYNFSGEGDSFFPAAERQVFVNARVEL